MLDRSRSRDRSKTGGAFSPAGLFVTGAQGAWYDPSDFSTLYQTSTGTTPVTAVEQPVGLMLDRSRGLVLGSELVTNGSFTTDSDWTKGTDWTIAAGVASKTAGTAAFLSQAMSLVAGRAYAVTFTATVSAGTIQPQFSTTTSVLGTARSASGTYTEILIAVTGNDTFRFLANSTFAGTIDNVSVRELPGNHALQATSASRPVLRARYNLLTYSEQFDNAAWSKQRTTVTANAVTAPDGTTTADAVFETVDNGTHGVFQSITKAAFATTYALSCYVKPNGRDWAILSLSDSGETNRVRVWFDLSGSGTVGSNVAAGSGFSFVSASIQSLSDGWYRCTAVITGDTSTTHIAYVRTATGDTLVSYVGDITKGLYIWGAQLLTAADQTSTGGAYQRIAAATDYDVSNPVWRPYLAFDGTDDFFNLASAISITTDMTVVRGFGRRAAGVETAGLGLSSATVPRDYRWDPSSNNSSYGLGDTAAIATSGDTATGFFVSSIVRNATTEIARRNGSQIATRSAPAVSGSFNQFGRLGALGTNNGPIYGLIVLDRELTGSELTATEQWMAGKTGAVLA